MSDPQPINLLSSLADFIVRINAKGKILHASEPALAFLDLPASLVGETIDLLIHPEDIADFLKTKDKWRNPKLFGSVSGRHS